MWLSCMPCWIDDFFLLMHFWLQLQAIFLVSCLRVIICADLIEHLVVVVWFLCQIWSSHQFGWLRMHTKYRFVLYFVSNGFWQIDQHWTLPPKIANATIRLILNWGPSSTRKGCYEIAILSLSNLKRIFVCLSLSLPPNIIELSLHDFAATQSTLSKTLKREPHTFELWNWIWDLCQDVGECTTQHNETYFARFARTISFMETPVQGSIVCPLVLRHKLWVLFWALYRAVHISLSLCFWISLE